MYLFITLLLGFVVFVIIYARYLNASGNISKRRIQLENFQDQVEFRVKKLSKGTRLIRLEINEAKAILVDMENSLRGSEGEEGDV